MSRKLSAKSSFFQLIEQCTLPLYVLSPHNEIVFCNSAVQRWLDASAETLIGTVCHPQGSGDVAATAPRWRGLGIPPESQQRSQIRWTVFVPSEMSGREPGIQQLAAEAWKLPSSGSHPHHWLVKIGQTELPADDSELQSIRLQIAEMQQTGYSSARIPAMATGSSVRAKVLRRQMDVAIRSSRDMTLVGPTGMELETWAHYLFRKMLGADAPPLLQIDCRLADQYSIQETLRRISRPAYPHATERSREDWLLLRNVEQLAPMAAMELNGFLEMPQLRLRLIATSHQLPNTWPTDTFPDELWTRLQTQCLIMEPMSVRPTDRLTVFQHVLETAAASAQVPVPTLDEASQEFIREYHWPQNSDEMRTEVNAWLKTTSATPETPGVWTLEDFSQPLRMAHKLRLIGRKTITPINLPLRLEMIERAYLEWALQQTKFNKAQAARLLGINRPRLLRRCEQLGVNIPTPQTAVEFEPVDGDEISFQEEDEA